MFKKEFDELAQKLGSKYAAVNYIAKSAREKMAQSNTSILDSKAISWAITGIEPERKKKVTVESLINSKSFLEDMLCYVDEESICKSVRDSYQLSCYTDHLIYQYQPELNDYEKSRVRILTRIAWYNKNRDTNK